MASLDDFFIFVDHKHSSNLDYLADFLTQEHRNNSSSFKNCELDQQTKSAPSYYWTASSSNVAQAICLHSKFHKMSSANSVFAHDSASDKILLAG